MVFPLYAGLLVFLYIFLTALVIRARLKNRVSLGAGGYEDLERYIRAHGNFVETVPFALILLLTLELQHASIYLIHLLGLMLLIGRIVHPMTIIKAKYSVGKGRMIGMILTLSMILISGLACLYFYFLSIMAALPV